MYKATKYLKIRLQYKWPFLKVKGQFTSSFSNRMLNFKKDFKPSVILNIVTLV